MAEDFVVWDSLAGSKYIAVKGLLDVPDVFEIKRGVSRASGFPPAAHFAPDPRSAKSAALPDSLVNLEGMILVSARLKEVLAPLPLVEILPVQIDGHPDAPYFIVSPLQLVDCIDQEASEVDWNAIDPTLISGLAQLVLKEDAIPDDAMLFRPKHLPHKHLLRRSVAEDLVARGFTGVKFWAVDEFEL